MKTPFTLDQFLQVFKNYNEAVYPTQIFLYLASFLAIYLVFKPSSRSNKFISSVLAIFWLWMGIVYHLLFFTKINNAAFVFGILFILQAVLFLTYGVFKDKLSFSYHPEINSIIGILLVLFALIIYPVLGYFLGHVYPSSPTFGLPCPTTIFTFGILLLSDKKMPVALIIIPFLWSIIGFTAAFSLGIWEDTGLFIAGLLSTGLILSKNRKFISENNQYNTGTNISG